MDGTCQRQPTHLVVRQNLPWLVGSRSSGAAPLIQGPATSSQSDVRNMNFRRRARSRGTFSRHHEAASGAVRSRMANAADASTAYPDCCSRRPSNPHKIAASRFGGPESTPDVKAVSGLLFVSGNTRPTHFSRTHCGASPGGTPVIRMQLVATAILSYRLAFV